MTESISEIIARTCWVKHSSDSLLLALLSPGLDTDGVIAHLALRSLAASAQSKARFDAANTKQQFGEGVQPLLAAPIFFLLVSDNTESSAIHRIAEGLRLAISLIDSSSPQYAQLLGDGADGSALVQVHAVEEGSSPKQRTDAYLQGGIVVMGGRFFCADVLHHRVTLHFSLVGAVIYIPCLHRHWLPVPTAPRRVAKHLASLAFATELLCARNAKLNRQSTSGVESYPSTWSWAVTASAQHQEGNVNNTKDGEAALSSLSQWLLKAPLFMISDHPPAMLHCLRSRTILEGRPFLKSFHVGVIEVFPRFRLDIVKQLERPQSLRLELECVPAAMSPIDAALVKALRAVVQEVLEELEALESRLAASHSLSTLSEARTSAGGAGAEEEPRRKQQRVEKESNSWSDVKRPCGVHFARVLCDDALSWGRNGLEATLRDALSSNASSVAPYRRLILSLEDVLYLDHQSPLLAPGTFLIVLENLVTVEERFTQWGVGGTNTADSRRPLWTLSDRFSDIVQLATARVFDIVKAEQPKPDTIVHHNVDSDDDDDDDDDDVVVCDGDAGVQQKPSDAFAAPVISIRPPAGSPGEFLTLVKTVALGWARTMARKVQQHRTKHHSEVSPATVGIPSMLIVVEEESTLRQIVLQLCMDQQTFAQMELERFLLAYQRLHGGNASRVTTTSTAGGRGKQPSVIEGGQTDGDMDSDGHDEDDDEFRGGGDVPEHILTQHRSMRTAASSSRPQSTTPALSASPLNAAFLHTALLSQPLTHASLLTALDSDDHFMEAVSASQLQSSASPNPNPNNLVGAVNVQCVGKVDGCVILSATVRHSDGADVVMIRLVNASYLTPQTLLLFWHAHGPSSSSGASPIKGSRDWDHSGLVPPIGRIVLCSPTLRTLRVVESFQDLVTSHVAPGSQQPKLKVQIIQSISPNSSFGDASESNHHHNNKASTSVSARELTEENATFHQLLMIKSNLTEVLFVDRDSRLETEQHLMSGLSRNAKLQRSSTPSPLSSLAAMPMYLRLRRAPAQGDGGSHAGTESARASSSPLVIFDEREFRSSLPYHFYCQGFDVLPLTLLHGDYLLSSNYALERKAIPDLIQSLNSGRIHHQLSSLSRIFVHPVLLVEFTKSAAFRFGAQEDGRFGDIQRRLMSCLAGNPRVMVVWSRSAQHTATLGMRIRQTFADATTNADPADSTLTQKKENEGAADSIYAMRVLRTFPGIDSSNMTAIMNAAGSLAGLASLSQTAVINAIGHEKGLQLYTFLHGNIIESV